MDDLLSRCWWMLALRGVIALALGMLALLFPGMMWLALVAIFAAYALLGGAVAIVGAMKNRKSGDDWWLPLLLGLASVGAGAIAVLHPNLTILVLTLVMGANALISGMLDIAVAIRLRKTMRREWLLVLNAVASIVFGVLVFLYPEMGALALIFLVSLYATISGMLLLALGLRLRRKPKAGAGSTAQDRRVITDRRHAAGRPA